MRRESALSPLADERQCAGCEQLIVAHASRFSKEQRSDQVVDKYEIEQTNECWYVESASQIPTIASDCTLVTGGVGMDPTLRKLSTKFVMSATMSSSLAAKEASSWSRVDLDRPKLGELSEAEVPTSVPTTDGGDVTEARMPAKAGEALAKSEDCR